MIEISTNGDNCSGDLERLIRAGRFVVTEELGPPKGWRREVIEEKGELLRGVVDADYGDTLMHVSGNLLKENGGRQVKPFKRYIGPGTRRR